MTDLKAIKDDLVFGLDIGTRSIVGVVGYLSHQVFHVVAMAEEELESFCKTAQKIENNIICKASQKTE